MPKPNRGASSKLHPRQISHTGKRPTTHQIQVPQLAQHGAQGRVCLGNGGTELLTHKALAKRSGCTLNQVALLLHPRLKQTWWCVRWIYVRRPFSSFMRDRVRNLCGILYAQVNQVTFLLHPRLKRCALKLCKQTILNSFTRPRSFHMWYLAYPSKSGHFLLHPRLGVCALG